MFPKSHLEYYSKVYPHAWKDMESMRLERGKGIWWPKWCFLPLAGAYATISAESRRQGGEFDVPRGLINDVGVLGALFAWRVTQGVYRFDQDVFKSIISTPITGDVPHDVFFNLPEWCVYIETPSLTYSDNDLKGFFAQLEYDTNTNRTELRFVLDFGYINSETPFLLSIPIHLGPWSLSDSISRMIDESAIQSVKHGIEVIPIEEPLIENLKGKLESLVSLVLYLCTLNSEIDDGNNRPTKPRPSKKNKKGSRSSLPNSPRVWDVGVRMGALIRRDKAKSADASGESSGISHSSPRAHIRRAHWHGFWSGSRNVPEEKEYTLKWIPPILVNANDDEDIPVTIRPVE